MTFRFLQESYPDLTASKDFADKLSISDRVMIAMLNLNFNLEDVDAELLIDVYILKTFDALTSYEQLLLKCSSILGDTFPREMLLYIMNSTGMRITALGKNFDIDLKLFGWLFWTLQLSRSFSKSMCSVVQEEISQKEVSISKIDL